MVPIPFCGWCAGPPASRPFWCADWCDSTRATRAGWWGSKNINLFFPIREGGFNFNRQERCLGRGALVPIWKAGVPTTPIARSRRDLQNVRLDLCLKLRKQMISYQNRAKPVVNSGTRIRVLLAAGLARGGATGNPARSLRWDGRSPSCSVAFQIGFVSPQV